MLHNEFLRFRRKLKLIDRDEVKEDKHGNNNNGLNFDIVINKILNGLHRVTLHKPTCLSAF